MSLQELPPDAQIIADQILSSFDGRTEQQRYYDTNIEPRALWLSRLAIWDEYEPQIIRGEE